MGITIRNCRARRAGEEGLVASIVCADYMAGIIDARDRWTSVYRFCMLNGPCALYDAAEMEAGQERVATLHATTILVIGAGGLGCELLKDLALVGFTDIHLIDCDHIDLSNLNRQFLFRAADVGSSKAEVAARFINQRIPGCTVVPHAARIEEFGAEFYSRFKIVISGLDAIGPRRWINSTLCGLVQFDAEGNPDPDTIIPLIDGGTEGFKGQARVIFPMVTTCFECALDAFPPQVNYPLCTLAETPRLPEHCVEWASILQWPENFPDTKLDGDNPEHIKWVFQKALGRAEEHSIQGVTYQLAMGVVKRIIPAVASTNAVIAAACANEAFKIATYCASAMGDGSNYMQFNGTDGLYVYTFEYERKEDCLVCSNQPRQFLIGRSDTVQDVPSRTRNVCHVILI